MQLKLEKNFPVPVPATVAWKLLSDIEAVSECMPGTQLTEKVDDTHYKGVVKVKIGPVSASFKGDAEIRRLDSGRRELQVVGKGSEVSGTSAASIKLAASIRELASDRCEVSGASEVSISGKLALFGARLVNEVSNRLFLEFVNSFTDRAVAMASVGAPSQPAAEAAKPAAAREINVLAIVIGIIADFFKRLFGWTKQRADG